MRSSKYIIKILKVTSLLLGVVFVFLNISSVYAGTYVSTHGDIHSKDVVAIDIILDTEGRTLNAVEGTVSLSGTNFIVKDISVAGSALTLWPRKPSLSNDGAVVSFIGGTPMGLNDAHAHLFTLFVQVGAPGTMTVSHSSVAGYMNDGLGTKVVYKEHTNQIPVLVALDAPIDAQATVVSSDNQLPEPFSIEILQDPNENAGMKYAYFETTDKRSGIAYYEVIEGTREPVRSGTSYVLQNQSKNEPLIVLAYDKAGNIRIATHGMNRGITRILVAVGALILILLIVFRKKIRALIKRHAH